MIALVNANSIHIPLRDKSVQCVITSPPYYGLRDYGTAQWEGGDPECDHKQSVARHDGGRVNVNGFHGSSASDSDKGQMNYRDVCQLCGAVRIDQQIGLETTPAEYVAHIVTVARELWRVLRDDGTMWLNLASSYSSGIIESDEYIMRDDLTQEEIEYVYQELARAKSEAMSKMQKADASAEQYMP